MYILYSALLSLVLLVTFPYWLVEMFRHGKYRQGLAQRMGRGPATLGGNTGRVIWVHAVSVGEVLAVSGLVSELRRRYPEWRVVISTTTDTGQKLAKSRFGEENV